MMDMSSYHHMATTIQFKNLLVMDPREGHDPYHETSIEISGEKLQVVLQPNLKAQCRIEEAYGFIDWQTDGNDFYLKWNPHEIQVHCGQGGGFVEVTIPATENLLRQLYQALNQWVTQR